VDRDSGTASANGGLLGRMLGGSMIPYAFKTYGHHIPFDDLVTK